MLPPRLSRRSRRKAGESAVKARQERAKVKKLITNGELFFFDLFEDERKSVKRMKLMDLLQSVPGIGKVRAEIVMGKAQISPSRRIGGVGKRQLEILRQEFLLIKNSRRSGKLLVVSGPSGVGKSTLTNRLRGDERFDYVYKFVSKDSWKKMIAAGKSPLDEGTLYVAKYLDNGTGEWLELSPKNPLLAGWKMDYILVNTRLAADAVGATKMDRPEWIAASPKGDMYVTLTNNTQRGTTGRAGVNSANPTAVNSSGHIIRWKDADKHVGKTFNWEIFVLAKDVADTGGQMFGSPDGIWVDPDGRVFVQTDGAQPGGNNDQLLVADPVTREFKRLFTGVKGSEVTGVTTTPDRKTMFVNLQHPGDGSAAVSNFPEFFVGASGPVPRDCTIVIKRINGGVIGS